MTAAIAPPIKPPSNVCGQCGRTRVVLIVYQDRYQLCGSCYSDGAFHSKIGSKQFKQPDDSELPAPGSYAGTLPSTGEGFTYTDQVINMKTGERRTRR